MSVPVIPTYEEFFGIVDNELTDSDFQGKTDDDEINKIITSLLLLLQQFYLTHQYYNPSDVFGKDFKSDLNDLRGELYDTLLVLMDEYEGKLLSDGNVEYLIPDGVVSTTFDLTQSLKDGIDDVITQLESEAKSNASYFMVATVAGSFSLHSNFRRAVKRLSQTVEFNAQLAKKLIERTFLGFVHGDEALYDWIPSGRNTCAWCYMIADRSPMPLSMLPVDHIHGECRIRLHTPDVYSDEYKEIRGWD